MAYKYLHSHFTSTLNVPQKHYLMFGMKLTITNYKNRWQKDSSKFNPKHETKKPRQEHCHGHHFHMMDGVHSYECSSITFSSSLIHF